MIGAGWNVVLTHGNGPQVGFILRRSEIADGQVPTVPVQYAVGDTQGAIGFMFQNALGNALQQRGLTVPVVTLVTQTLVDRRDPAFAKPDKPIGSFMTEEVARQLASELGWTVMQDSNRGWRRVIASPQPVRVIEAPIIERLAREGVLIIACGGGGIAVEQLANGELRGLEAVIDKDRASALLAHRNEGRPADDPDRRAARGDPLRPARPAVARSHHRAAGRGLRGRGPLRRRQHGPEDRGLAQVRQRPRGWARRHHQRREHRARAARRDRHLDRILRKTSRERTMETTLLAVNGTLMRGLELNPNMLAVGATFVREDDTDACYRIWSIGDRHPAMQRTPGGGAQRGARAVGGAVGGPGVDPAERAAGPGDRQGGAEGRLDRARRAGRTVSLRGAARDHVVRRLARLHRSAANVAEDLAASVARRATALRPGKSRSTCRCASGIVRAASGTGWDAPMAINALPNNARVISSDNARRQQ